MSQEITLIYCHHLKEELEALNKAPLPGPLGSFIKSHISKKAWSLWTVEQIKFINENQLSLNDSAHRLKIKEKMVDFFNIDKKFLS